MEAGEGRSHGEARYPCHTSHLMPRGRKTFLCHSTRAPQRSATRIIDLKEGRTCNTGDERARPRWELMSRYKPHMTVSAVATRFARKVAKVVRGHRTGLGLSRRACRRRDERRAHAPDAVYGLIIPEDFESVGRHGRVAHRMLNIFMPQIILNGPGIMPLRRQVIATRMPELVGMGDKGKPGHFACSRYNFANRSRGQRCLTLGDEHIRGVGIGALECP